MRAILFLAAVSAATPLTAEVLHSSPNGLEVQQSVEVPVAPEAAWTKFEQIGSWWNPEHSYSGKAANLRLALSIGACFCEMFEETGGGVEHMRVVFAQPHKRAILTGSLGPLLSQATIGVMDLRFEPVGRGTRVTVVYRVSGFYNGGGDKMAPLVDQVIGEQVKRFAAYAAK